MKVVIINKSDSTGGAAVVSFRLMNALRALGVEASMLVVEKKTDSPHVHVAASSSRIKRPFLSERLKIFLANGLRRDLVFKVDLASDGLPLHRHRLVREADVICLNWVNQGMLSLMGLDRLLSLGKPVVWTMHDMWNFTGICHHAGTCERWHVNCGLCPLLGNGASTQDLSFAVWNDKKAIYGKGRGKLRFVAVSNWLASLARKSTLTPGVGLSVIPNAFPIPSDEELKKDRETSSVSADDNLFRIIMGAARLDDPVKGLPILIETTKILREKYPEEASRIELVTFGNLKDPSALDGVRTRHRHLGIVRGEEKIRKIYSSGNAVVSASLYETLPGTLVEGQVYGCIPVSFGRGGQSDIVDHLSTGYIAEWNDDPRIAAENIARGIIWSMSQSPREIRTRMLDSARSRFSAEAVASRYIELFHELGVE